MMTPLTPSTMVAYELAQPHRQGAHDFEQRARKQAAEQAHRNGDEDAEQNRLYGGPRRAIGILFADSPRHHGHGADAQAHRKCV